jgi:hypothetical protein
MEDRLRELQEQIDNTDCFITKMELSGEYEDLMVRYGKTLPPKPLDSDYFCEGCGS